MQLDPWEASFPQYPHITKLGIHIEFVCEISLIQAPSNGLFSRLKRFEEDTVI